MANNAGHSPKKDLIPPNVVAFVAGVLLALVVGLIFRKVIDKVAPDRRQTALRAQTPPETALQEEQKATSEKLNDVPEAAAQTAPSAGTSAEGTANTNPTEKNQAGTKTPSQAPASDEKLAAAQKAKPSAPPSEDLDAETTKLGEVDYLAWRRTMKSLEEMISKQGIRVTAVTLTPRYRHQAKSIAITRGQFLDVVSRKVPANLPTRQNNLGLVFHALGPADFDSKQFAKAASESGTRLESLCRPPSDVVSTAGVERVTVIVSNTPTYFRCLQDWLSTNPDLKNVLELSLIGFTRGPTFFGSITSDKKLFSLQMWNPDWLVDNTVAMDETGRETPAQKRTLRLANVTRALGQPSDVRMQIPASTRPLAGPLIEPKDPTPAKPLVIGNFALVPSHMPRGTLIATAYTSAQQGRGKSASVTPPGPGRARALVLATQGKKLQFMTVTRE